MTRHKLGRIEPLAEEKSSQVSLLLGPQLADLASLTDWYLPKAAIDKATIRMSELLKQRHGMESQPIDLSDGTLQEQQGAAE